VYLLTLLSLTASALAVLSLKDPAALIAGIRLRDAVSKSDLVITSLAQLKPRNLYETARGHAVLRISPGECLFAGKSTITFDPLALGYNMSLPELLQIVQQNQTFEAASGSSASVLSPSGAGVAAAASSAAASASSTATALKLGMYAANFFRSHISAEHYAAKMNGTRARSFT
jgi:hypothetical protein